jgi:hypothetical protein
MVINLVQLSQYRLATTEQPAIRQQDHHFISDNQACAIVPMVIVVQVKALFGAVAIHYITIRMR